MHTLVYVCKMKLLCTYYRTHDSTQNGVQVEKVMMILWPVRSIASFKPQLILYQKCAYLVVKKKESGDQRKSTFTNLA